MNTSINNYKRLVDNCVRSIKNILYLTAYKNVGFEFQERNRWRIVINGKVYPKYVFSEDIQRAITRHIDNYL